MKDNMIYEVVDGRRLEPGLLCAPIGKVMEGRGLLEVNTINLRGVVIELEGEDTDPFERTPTGGWIIMTPEGTITCEPLTLKRYNEYIKYFCPLYPPDTVISSDADLRAHWRWVFEET